MNFNAFDDLEETLVLKLPPALLYGVHGLPWEDLHLCDVFTAKTNSSILSFTETTLLKIVSPTSSVSVECMSGYVFLHNDNGFDNLYEILHLPGSFKDVPSAYVEPVQIRLVILRVLQLSHPLLSECLDWSRRGIESEIYLSGISDI